MTYLNLDKCSTIVLHPTWQNLTCPLTIKKATVKALLLVGRYPLTTSPTAGTRSTEKCPLCSQEPETMVHFVLHCPTLRDDRIPYLNRVLQTCRVHNISVDTDTLVGVILDSTYLPKPSPNFERLTRDFIYKLHSKRAIALGGETGYKC